MSLRYVSVNSTVLRLAGADVLTYLQRQCTTDLRKGPIHQALWLNRKGRVLSQTGVLWGEGGPAWGSWNLMSMTAYGVRAWNVLAPADAILPWPLASLADLESIRIQYGVSKVPADCGSGEFPQECGLDAWISYTKGCYLGQEVMARIQSMGSLRKILRKVKLVNGAFRAGQELRSSENAKNAGTVKSVAGPDGLALVSIDCSEDSQLVTDTGEVRLGKPAQLVGNQG